MLRAVTALRKDFAAAGHEVPDVRVSVGWPGGRGNKQHVIGQCWAASAVADGKPAIFVSPVLDDPVAILVTLVHEMVHATGIHGHRSPFAKVGAAVGLTAPWKSTPASEPLTERLTKLAAKLGAFDHGKVSGGSMTGVGPTAPPTQSTRMLKVVCPTCDYTVRTTRKWLDIGLPSCPDGDLMEES